MGRHGYSEDCDEPWQLAMWRGAVASALRGKRGQVFLRALADALDAMPEKRLVAEELVTPEGEVCALGQLGKVRGLDLRDADPYDHDALAALFGVSGKLIQELEYVNDEHARRETPEERWQLVREWVGEQLAKPKAAEVLP